MRNCTSCMKFSIRWYVEFIRLVGMLTVPLIAAAIGGVVGAAAVFCGRLFVFSCSCCHLCLYVLTIMMMMMMRYYFEALLSIYPSIYLPLCNFTLKCICADYNSFCVLRFPPPKHSGTVCRESNPKIRTSISFRSFDANRHHGVSGSVLTLRSLTLTSTCQKKFAKTCTCAVKAMIQKGSARFWKSMSCH